LVALKGRAALMVVSSFTGSGYTGVLLSSPDWGRRLLVGVVFIPYPCLLMIMPGFWFFAGVVFFIIFTSLMNQAPKSSNLGI
jgi:hypothetical protein